MLIPSRDGDVLRGDGGGAWLKMMPLMAQAQPRRAGPNVEPTSGPR